MVIIMSNVHLDGGKSSKGIMRYKEVLTLLGISRSTLWRWERQQPDFPKRIVMSERSVGWLRGAVEEWIATRETVQPTPLVDNSPQKRRSQND